MNGTGGIHVIVSPLIALAAEQVETLKSRGLKAFRVGDAEGFDIVTNNPNDIVFVISSPESLRTDQVRLEMQNHIIFGISIDEGHCVSECKDNITVFLCVEN